MRDIKFRGKIAISSGWAYGHYALVKENGQEYPVIYENGRPLIVRIHTVSQYTGLKDKNGKEIYEKDVLFREGYWGYYIGFEKGCFVTVPLDEVQRINWEHKPLKDIDLRNWEVIGNIYQDKHLLEEST